MKISYKHIAFIGFLFVFLACKNKSEDDQIKVINDAFLAVADTIAYYELSLRPLPPPDFFEKKGIIKYANRLYDHFGIVVPDTLYPLINWSSSLKLYCKSPSLNDSGLIELKRQICNEIDNQTPLQIFKTNQLKDLGRYEILNEKSRKKVNFPVVGRIEFSQVAFDKDINVAAFIAFITDGGAGIVKLFQLRKKIDRWEVENIEDYELVKLE